jgi:hypothetical protein
MYVLSSATDTSIQIPPSKRLGEVGIIIPDYAERAICLGVGGQPVLSLIRSKFDER